MIPELEPKFKIGDLVTHETDDDWMGIILEVKNRSISPDGYRPGLDIPCWYCKVRFSGGLEQWHNDLSLNLRAAAQ